MKWLIVLLSFYTFADEPLYPSWEGVGKSRRQRIQRNEKTLNSVLADIKAQKTSIRKYEKLKNLNKKLEGELKELSNKLNGLQKKHNLELRTLEIVVNQQKSAILELSSRVDELTKSKDDLDTE